MKYSTAKQKRKIINKTIDIMLYPLRRVCQPLYKIHEEKKKYKKYSKKTVYKLVQYLIDYWCDGEDEFYIFVDDKYNPFDYYNTKSIHEMISDMSWYGNKRIKRKLQHLYFYQKEMFINAVKKIAGTPMSSEDKKIWFHEYSFYQVENREVCKLK